MRTPLCTRIDLVYVAARAFVIFGTQFFDEVPRSVGSGPKVYRTARFDTKDAVVFVCENVRFVTIFYIPKAVLLCQKHYSCSI